MGEMNPESQGFEQQDNSQGQQPDNQQQDSGTGINPAWNDLLGSLPSSLHSQVIPHLQKWDQNYQTDIGKVHSQYEAYKPFVESQVDPEAINYGLQLMEILNERPEELYQALAEQYGNQQQQSQENPQQQGQQSQTTEQGQESPIDISNHPEFQRVNQMVETMAQLLVQQNSQEQEAQEDQALEKEFADAKSELGEFDETWVMAHLLAGNYDSVASAAKAYKDFEQGILSNANRPGPRVLSSGGTTANPPVSPTEMSDKDRKAYVAQILQQAAQQSG